MSGYYPSIQRYPSPKTFFEYIQQAVTSISIGSPITVAIEVLKSQLPVEQHFWAAKEVLVKLRFIGKSSSQTCKMAQTLAQETISRPLCSLTLGLRIESLIQHALSGNFQPLLKHSQELFNQILDSHNSITRESFLSTPSPLLQAARLLARLQVVALFFTESATDAQEHAQTLNDMSDASFSYDSFYQDSFFYPIILSEQLLANHWLCFNNTSFEGHYANLLDFFQENWENDSISYYIQSQKCSSWEEKERILSQAYKKRECAPNPLILYELGKLYLNPFFSGFDPKKSLDYFQELSESFYCLSCDLLVVRAQTVDTLINGTIYKQPPLPFEASNKIKGSLIENLIKQVPHERGPSNYKTTPETYIASSDTIEALSKLWDKSCQLITSETKRYATVYRQSQAISEKRTLSELPLCSMESFKNPDNRKSNRKMRIDSLLTFFIAPFILDQ